MRILMTTDTVGGVWTFTKELARQLLDEGHALALVSFGRKPSADQRAWCSYLEYVYGARFLYCDSAAPLEWMSDNDRAYEAGEELLLDVAEHFEPDVFHANQYCFGRIPLDIPRLITAHSDVLSWADACRPAGLEDSAWLDRYCELVQEGLDGADCVVAPTAWMLTALTEHFSVNCSSRVVHNGRTVPRALRAPHRSIRAISAGRLWDEAKGLTTLMHVNSPMPVMIAGEESFDGNASPVPAQMQALGSLDEPALFAALRSSSIYIAASRYEPFGLAPLEAALCGCAVVARDTPSLREVWGDAAAYFTDAPALQRLLGFMADDPAALQQAQIAAMERARRYKAEEMAAAYVDIYSGLLKRAGKESRSDDEEYISHAA
jgi:glycosyltransferase involved in cell wall biosynthesis